MNESKKVALKALESLYNYALELMPRNREKYDLGVKYRALKDDLKEAINE